MDLVRATPSARLIHTDVRTSPLADANSDHMLLPVNIRVRQSTTLEALFLQGTARLRTPTVGHSGNHASGLEKSSCVRCLSNWSHLTGHLLIFHC